MDIDSLTITDTAELVNGVLSLYFDAYQSVCNLVTLVAGTFFVTFPIFVIVLGVTLLGRRRFAPWVRYSLWTIVLVRLILPVSLTSPISAQRLWSAFQIDQNRESDTVQNRLLSVVLPPDLSSTNSLSLNDESTTPKPSILDTLIPNLLMSFWTLLVGGSILLAAGSVIAFIRIVLWVRNGGGCSDRCCLELVEEGRRLFGLRAHVQLWTVPQLKCPTTFDWFRPTIFLPEYITTMSTAERRQIIWHELARIRRGDSATSVLLMVVRILHWWNPLFWWTQQRWLTERELASDELALSRLCEEDVAEEYAQTLQRLHEKQPKTSWSMFWYDAPGFIMMIASKSTLRRRIERLKTWDCVMPDVQQTSCRLPLGETRDDESTRALDVVCSAPMRTDGRWQYWFSWCLLLTLAVSGLTDEVKLPPGEYPIELPLGATWHDSAVAELASESIETRSYDLSPCINRLRQDEPNVPTDIAEENLRLQFESKLRPINSPDQRNVSAINPISPGESKCQRIGGQLVVQATPSQHSRIATLLSNWASHGQQQITIEFRSYTTQRQLSQLLPASGGHVFNSKSITHQFEVPVSIGATTEPRVTSKMAEQSPVPVFIQVLMQSDAVYFGSHLWPEGTRVSMLFAPKVTIFEGSTATITDGSIRPFATGFLTGQSGTLEPSISTFEDGIRIQTSAHVDSGKIHLSVGCHMSQILDVQVRKLRSQSKELNIQIPKVHETLLESTAELNDGESLILVPLQRSERGDLTIFLITPRIVDIHEIEEELLGLPRD